MMNLNLGCGSDIRKGWINLDKINHDGVDIVCDINKKKLPFPDKYFDLVYADNILEHTINYEFVIREIYRVLKPDGILKVIVPYFKSVGNYSEFHVRHFGWKSFLWKDPKKGYCNSVYEGFIEIEKKLIFNPKMPFKGLFYLLANKYPILYEYTPLSVLFPAQLIHVELKKL